MRTNYLIKKIKEHDKELLGLLVVVAVYLAGSILWLMMRGEVTDDEFYSLRDIFGIFHTGKLLTWDFYTNTITNEVTSWQLDFVLLAKWMKLLGTTPLALRSVSTIYGTLAVVSFAYVVRRLTENHEWTFWTSLLFAVNPLFLELSANIRGYTLLVLLNVWVFYWSYRALNADKLRHVCIYGIGALAFAYAAYRVRIFEVIYLCGIVIYIFAKAFITRKKRYIVMSAGASFLGVSFLMFAVLGLSRFIPAIGRLANGMELISMGWNEPRYITDLLKICWIYPVSAVGVLLCLYNLFKKDIFNPKQKDVMIYALSIVLGTMFFFLCVVDWMHDTKYLLAVHWAMILVITGGFHFFSETLGEKKRGIIQGIFICIILSNIYGNAVNAMARNDEKFTEAYNEIQEAIEAEGTELLFFTGGEVREYYARDIFGEHEREMLPVKDSETYDHISDLSKIGEMHPRGIILFEEKRMGGITYYFERLLKTDAFEQITGTGLDDSLISSWKYHVENPEVGKIEGEKTSIRFGYNYGGAVKFTEEDNKTVLELEINGSAPEKMLLCIKINQFSNGESRKRYVQLVLEPNGESLQYYRIELENDEKVEKSMIDETYYIYVNESEPQMFTDFYTL